MISVLFWLSIIFASCVSPSVLASDNPHVDTCTRVVNTNRRSATDFTDTVSYCKYIQTSHSASCLEKIAVGFTKYEGYQNTDGYEYDGIDFRHIQACQLYLRNSSVQCLGEILAQRRPTFSDILSCGDE